MEQLGITVFDVAVAAVAIFGALIGMSSGFAHAVLFIASWVAAGWVAWNYAKLIQPEVEKLVTSTERNLVSARTASTNGMSWSCATMISAPASFSS